MKTPTLGYEEDSAVTKQAVAIAQLEGAIALFVSEKWICAVTLAGAAEGVLSGLLAARRRPSATEETVAQVGQLRKQTGLTIACNASSRDMFRHWNNARNLLKHHSPGEEEVFTVNLCDEAYWMIRRALRNAKELSLVVRNSDEFENWAVVNINMEPGL
jgi:hypothetical protein